MSKTIAHFFNVGHGDCTLIEAGNDQLILIDSKRRPGGKESPALAIIRDRYKNHLPIDLGLVCLTHPDRDHYSGMLQILQYVLESGGHVNGVVTTGFEYKILRSMEKQRVLSQHIADYEAAYRELDDLFSLLHQQRQLGNFGPHPLPPVGPVDCYILGPTADASKRNEQQAITEMLDKLTDQIVNPLPPAKFFENLDKSRGPSANSISIILWLRIGELKIMCTGDTSGAHWDAAVEGYRALGNAPFGDLPSSVLKPPHHGSKCESPDIWKDVLADSATVVISAGEHGDWEHPSDDTLVQIKAACPSVDLFCTNMCPYLRNRYRGILPAEVGLDLQNRGLPREAYHGDIRCVVDSSGHAGWEHDLIPWTKCPHHVLPQATQTTGAD